MIAIQDLPAEEKTLDVCLQAVKNDGALLRYVPDNMITREMCEIALKDRGKGLDYIPDRLFDIDLVWLAIENTPDDSALYLLERIPERYRSQEICSVCVNKLGHNLAYVPDDLKTIEMCRRAADTHSSILLQFFPERLKSGELEDILVEIISQRGEIAFRFVPPYLITEKICIAAIEKEGSHGHVSKILMRIPEEVMSEGIAMSVAKVCPWDLGMIPEKFLSEEMLLIGIEKAEIVAQFVPPRLQTPELLEKMLGINPMFRKTLEREGWYNPRRMDLGRQTNEDNGYTISDGTLTKSKYRILGRAIIPEGVKCIGPRAFLYYGPIVNPFTLCHEGNGITQISFPTSLRSIGDDAFGTCPDLQEVTLPEGLESIGRSIFRDSNKLSRIWIPASVKSIDEKAFFSGIMGKERLNNLTIYAPERSCGQKYAEEHGFRFVPCDSESYIPYMDNCTISMT